LKKFIRTIMIIMMTISLLKGQALLQGFSHPVDATGWGQQAISTFQENGTGVVLNPALAAISNHYLKFNYTNFVLDINSTSLAYGSSSSLGSYEIAVQTMNYGSWDRRDEAGNRLGSYSINDLYTKFTWGGELAKNFYMGINLNYGFSRLYEYTANYLTAGFGIIYTMPSGFTLGLSTINNELSGKSYVIDEKLESLIILGISKKLDYLPMRMGLDLIRTSNENYHANLGGKLSFQDIFLLWGLSSKREDVSTEDAVQNLLGGISGGFGVNIDQYSLAFGYRNLGGIGSILSFSVNWDLSQGQNGS